MIDSTYSIQQDDKKAYGEESMKFDFEDVISHQDVELQSDTRPNTSSSCGVKREMVSKPSDGTRSCGDTSHRNRFSRFPDSRDRPVVCRHWIRGLCWKGDDCEFIHQYDMKKLPLCDMFKRNGHCEGKERGRCLYSHDVPQTTQEDQICIHYFLGFCRSGPRCRKRHEPLDPDRLPRLLPDWYLQIILANAQSVIPDGMDPETETIMHKVEMLCRDVAGSNSVNTIHQREQQNNKGTTSVKAVADSLHQLDHLPSTSKLFIALHHHSTSFSNLHDAEPFYPSPHLQSFSDFPPALVKEAETNGIPLLPGAPALHDQVGVTRVFIIKSAHIEHLRTSIRLGVWATGRKNTQALEKAFDTSKHVVLLFSGNETRGFQGYGRMMTRTIPELHKAIWGTFSIRLGFNFRVQWLKQTNVPFTMFRSMVNPLNLNQSITKSRDCQEIPFKEAALICTMLANAPDNKMLNDSDEAAVPKIVHSTFFTIPECNRNEIDIRNKIRTAQSCVSTDPQLSNPHDLPCNHSDSNDGQCGREGRVPYGNHPLGPHHPFPRSTSAKAAYFPSETIDASTLCDKYANSSLTQVPHPLRLPPAQPHSNTDKLRDNQLSSYPSYSLKNFPRCPLNSTAHSVPRKPMMPSVIPKFGYSHSSDDSVSDPLCYAPRHSGNPRFAQSKHYLHVRTHERS